MPRAQAGPENHVWSAGGDRRRIESSSAVLEEIRVAAVEGFCRFPRGGLEVGGLLLGAVEDGVVRIQAARPVECEHLFGPSFVLSPTDGKRLSAALEAAQTNPAPTGLRVVGWYHSHTRSEVYLTDSDLEVYRKYFPEPWQVALVVRPEPFGTARAGFFLREADGSVRAERSYEEFVLAHAASGRGRVAAPLERDAVPGPIARPAPPPIPRREIVRPAPVVVPAPRPVERTSRHRLAWMVAAALVLLLAAGGVYLLNRTAETPRPLALRVLDSNGQLQISWDRSSPSVLEARSAGLDITDGTRRVPVPLTRARLRLGQLSYTRQSENVEVRMWVQAGSGRQQEEYVRVLGGLSPVELGRQAPPLPLRPPPAAAKTSPPPKTFNPARVPQPAKMTAGSVLPAPPVVASSDLRTARPAPLAARIDAPPPPAPARAPAPAAPAPAEVYVGPKSGRILWTGQLATGGALSVDGQRVSAGNLSAALPGVPVHVSVHPAELTARGLVVYTMNARTVRETPGPQNGWNETTYTREPRRASGLLVLEAPSAQAGWKHLAVRNDGPATSVIVIDWSTSE